MQDPAGFGAQHEWVCRQQRSRPSTVGPSQLDAPASVEPDIALKPAAKAPAELAAPTADVHCPWGLPSQQQFAEKEENRDELITSQKDSKQFVWTAPSPEHVSQAHVPSSPIKHGHVRSPPPPTLLHNSGTCPPSAATLHNSSSGAAAAAAAAGKQCRHYNNDALVRGWY
jgi:hypothetical protein